ncbi:hypothetical protein [Microbacterium sp. MPKO10]|uniref:hypothetical protein n=1 Tax=Microbacterium sp. MPKO10 TaxID=2989818 RepID=UPI0022356846|nr:hypothetical protein [Microbacterium sp. MPKO10]MCW4457667.1 hypothetical protein [Microbacterium sp. MPKO10]
MYASTPPQGNPAQDSWSAPQRPRARRRGSPWLFASLGAVAGLALGLLIGLVIIPATANQIAQRIEAAAPNPFESALEACNLDDSPHATIGDDGASLELQTFGDEASGIGPEEFMCVTDELDISDAVLSRIETTRALDGRQEASWGDFTASWTYHPDNGLNMLIERAPHDES